jgi:hypothetical protein
MLAYRNSGQMDKARREQQELEKLQRPPEGEFTDFLKRSARRRPASENSAWPFLVWLFSRPPSRDPTSATSGRKPASPHSFPNGGDKSKEYIIETTGSGVAFIDYDNDGYLDIFVLSGDGGTNRMYHNDRNGHFTDVTAELGLTSSGWAEGVCAGDYDNDGYTDLFVTYWGQNRLYRNVNGKRFEDVTAKAHLTQDRVRYNTGCAFLDYDGDGHLDLFVANYLKFDFATTPKAGSNPYCFYRGMAVNCGPAGSRSKPTCCTTTRAMGRSKTSR